MPPLLLPPLNPLWRPTDRSTVDDRELIRSYANWPLSRTNMHEITVIMNRAAEFPGTVTAIQGWIDEVQDLEDIYSGQVLDGTASLSNARSYEGARIGAPLTRDDLKKKADVLEWDTSLLRVKYESGGAGTSSTALLGARSEGLKSKILQALGIAANTSTQATVIRS
jgi:hypothetical protein